MPDQDVYSDRDAAPDLEASEAPETEESEDAPDEKEEGKDSDSATGLVSKTFFGDKELKPGTTCKVRVEKVYDDQVSISYVPHGKSDDSDDSEDDDKVEEDVYA